MEDFKHIKDVWDSKRRIFCPWWSANKDLKSSDIHTIFIEICLIDEAIHGDIKQIKEQLEGFEEDIKKYEEENQCKFDSVKVEYSWISFRDEETEQWALVGQRRETLKEKKIRTAIKKNKLLDDKNIEKMKKKRVIKKEKALLKKLSAKYSKEG